MVNMTILDPATPPTISLDSHIELRPLSTQLENGVLIIGWNDQFLELPAEGHAFIGWLNDGLSLGEARQRFEAEFNPFPDEELLAVMDSFLESDFIAAVDGQPITPQHAPTETQSEWISSAWAKPFFTTPMLLGWLMVTVPAMTLWVLTPSLWPRYQDYFWLDYNFLIILIGLLTWLIIMGMHETAHLLAARAKGIRATVTWTQRLGFIPMSQTVMHDIWAVPRNQRFLPLAAGMMMDVLSISLLIYLLYFQTIGWLTWPPVTMKFLKFLVLSITIGLTAQFWLFSKMDGYFLLSALFGQRNLQSDSYHWLTATVRRRPYQPPASGMIFIYLYAAIAVVWGGLFMAQFLVVNLPIKLRLIWESLLKVAAGTAVSLNFADGIAVLTSQTIDLTLLVYAYWRDKWSGWRSS